MNQQLNTTHQAWKNFLASSIFVSFEGGLVKVLVPSDENKFEVDDLLAQAETAGLPSRSITELTRALRSAGFWPSGRNGGETVYVRTKEF